MTADPYSLLYADSHALLYLLGAGVGLIGPLIKWTGAALAIGAGVMLVARWVGVWA